MKLTMSELLIKNEYLLKLKKQVDLDFFRIEAEGGLAANKDTNTILCAIV